LGGEENLHLNRKRLSAGPDSGKDVI